MLRLDCTRSPWTPDPTDCCLQQKNRDGNFLTPIYKFDRTNTVPQAGSPEPCQGSWKCQKPILWWPFRFPIESLPTWDAIRGSWWQTYHRTRIVLRAIVSNSVNPEIPSGERSLQSMSFYEKNNKIVTPPPAKYHTFCKITDKNLCLRRQRKRVELET